MRFGDFEIRPTVYLDGKEHPHDFHVDKWFKREKPIEVTDLETGEKKMQDTCCFAVARIWWNEKEPCWEFESVGTRFLEEYRPGLCEYILKWLELCDLCREVEKE